VGRREGYHRGEDAARHDIQGLATRSPAGFCRRLRLAGKTWFKSWSFPAQASKAHGCFSEGGGAGPVLIRRQVGFIIDKAAAKNSLIASAASPGPPTTTFHAGPRHRGRTSPGRGRGEKGEKASGHLPRRPSSTATAPSWGRPPITEEHRTRSPTPTLWNAAGSGDPAIKATGDPPGSLAGLWDARRTTHLGRTLNPFRQRGRRQKASKWAV